MHLRNALWTIGLIALIQFAVPAQDLPIREFRVGAAAIDVTPLEFPVIRNGGFLEGTDSRVADPLHARCLIFDDGAIQLAMVVVDSCMIPVSVCDQAKRIASSKTGIPTDRIMISATHTHSAPSVMDFCLGSRADERYRDFLPGKIAESIAVAHSRLQPAQIGFAKVDASTHTKCRRFITRSDKLGRDPFGDLTVHAMMHPGHLNPDYIGPSGPIDPWLSIMSVQTASGKPLAVLANFSMHYFGGHAGVSADYCGRFADEISKRIADDDSDFVGIMSQGTSGDLWWGDYSVPPEQKPFNDIDQFVGSLTDLAESGLETISYQSDLSLAMAEQRLRIDRRIPDEERLVWARRMNELRGDRLPKDRPEVYALQAVHLHENPTDEVVIQAIRIGDIAITGMPNEVYALTGLKLKRKSPLSATFNISLANGACGYIPPPEQHDLGGYTTWPASTAGLEVHAEPKIVSSLLGMLETITESPRQAYAEAETQYSQALIDSQPEAYWRFSEMSGRRFRNTTTGNEDLRAVGDIALHLPGRTDDAGRFGKVHDSHAIQLAGGKLTADELDLIDNYTVELLFRLGTPINFRPVTGTLVARGTDKVVISGTEATNAGRIHVGGHSGSTSIAPSQWYHLAFVRNGDFVQVYLDGVLEISEKHEFKNSAKSRLIIGGDEEDSANFEGRFDEAAVYNRALPYDEIATHLRAGGLALKSHLDDGRLDSSPLSPTESMNAIHIREGFKVELVAAEPFVQDPVAIDWAADGSLWVAEMADYPMGMDGNGKPGGRIRLLRDTNGDGKFDESTVFLDGVSFPNGVMAWGDGVLITAAPNVLYAEDTNGDSIADVRETLLSGFIEGNQQLRVNGLRWGLDGWVYCASGSHHAGFGARTKIYSTKQDKTFELGSRDFRFRPSTGEFEPASGPSQFGRVRDDFGNWFGVQNSQPLWHYVLEDWYVNRNPFVATIDARKQIRTPRMPRLYSAKPPQKRFHGFDHAGHYTSACGISIYRDSILFPRDEIHAFTCAPFHNLVQHHVLHDDGTSFRGQRADDGPVDFFASTDRWTRPVMSRTGPDGALWIVDMYRYMIEHPEWLPESARRELAPGYRAGEKYGRIYRITPVGESIRPVPDLSQCNPKALAQSITHPNGIVRDLAHRMLVHSPDCSTAAHTIHDVIANAKLAESQVQALSILSQIGSDVSVDVSSLLRDDDQRVRRHAILFLEALDDTATNDRHAVISELLTDDYAKVRLQLALACGDWSMAGSVLSQLATRTDNDRFMKAAIISSLRNHLAELTDAASNNCTFDATIFAALVKTSAIEAPDELAKIISASLQRDMIGSVRAGLQPQGINRIIAWLESLADEGVTLEDVATNRDKLGNAARQTMEFIDSVRSAADGTESLTVQKAACELLGRQPSRFADDIPILASLITPSMPSSVQRAAIRSLSRIPTRSAAGALVDASSKTLPSIRSAIVDALLNRPEWHAQLLTTIENRAIFRSELSLSQQQRLAASPKDTIAAKARTLFADQANNVVQSKQQLIAEYAAAISPGDAKQGETIFNANCQTCHTLDRNKRLVGPDLRSLTNRTPEFLLTAILDPSQSIDPRYTNYQFVLSDGRVFGGIVTNEDANSVELQLPDGKRQIISRNSIEEAIPQTISLMPEGFEKRLRPNDMSDLITFLQMQ